MCRYCESLTRRVDKKALVHDFMEFIAEELSRKLKRTVNPDEIEVKVEVTDYPTSIYKILAEMDR